MAVNKITNKQVVSSANINRAKEVSTKNIKSGNREMSIILELIWEKIMLLL